MNSFRFDGRAVEFTEGQTIGAALIANGIHSWRTTRRTGAPRGLFCGIGVCFDCLIRIGDTPNHRACQVVASPGWSVSSQDGTGHDDLA